MNFSFLSKVKLLSLLIFLPVALSAQFQAPPFIHGEIPILDNQVNLLSHGQDEFGFTVKDGKIIEVQYLRSQLEEINDDSKADLITELLDRKAAEYSGPESDNISLWTKGEFYAIFDVNEKLTDSKYLLKFFFTKD